MEKFDSTVSYKLIYVYSIPDEKHKGLLKVGETTLKTDKMPDTLVPNCHDLNQAAKKRNAWADTATVKYNLEYTELALRTQNGFHFPFSDKNVHEVLLNSGVRQAFPDGMKGKEWFETDLDTVKNAIIAVKEWKDSLSSAVPRHQTGENSKQKPIEFREEQIAAIEKTIKAFQKENRMLWYAKMRFGKTLTALEVIRRKQYRRVIIATHRPVVDDGWSEDFNKVFFPGNSNHEYHYVRKTKDSAYVYDEKTDAENDAKIRKLDKEGKYFIYFASVQDLRGSQLVGGNYNKNNAVFALDWELVIIDEAHEGTTTELGSEVLNLLQKKDTKVLSLSGTPFNLLGDYTEDNTYTWDYVMEQKAKEEWDLYHLGDNNPYAKLPKMHIYTYDLGEKLKQYVTDEYGSKAFKFSEFFRVYYKGPNGKRELPKGAVEGKFVHENDVKSFLNLLVKEGEGSGYPFSTQEYRDMFRHTLWMVPGVKEARALSEILHNHPVFQYFGIANVAGDGDDYEETHQKDALQKVREVIRDYKYSITLSCGKLTTGVTVPEWTAVLMLSGTFSTAASQYLQTIFRVQSPGDLDGKMKTDCFVFDFAPDRTLKVLTETVHLSRKPGRSEKRRREAMVEFLNYCPVISIAGSKTSKYSVESMMEQLKQIYAERAVNKGFDDDSLYNDELLRLDELDASMFNNLRDIIGLSKAQKKKDSVDVNNQGLTDEQIEHLYDKEEEGPEKKKTLTPEQQAEKDKIDAAKKQRRKAIDILRGVSIRMPLMIYGADVPVDEAIDVNQLIDIVDDKSWEEFMPQGVTKDIFRQFTKYYDRDVFIAAGKRIRHLAAEADKETPTRRVSKIAEIFRHFKNPDKETVLTPWRVVNLHMSETLGGWCFYNEKFEEDTDDERKRLDEPRFVVQEDITEEVFGEKARILEINSKTGLYPLYVAYSFYKQRMEGMADEDWEPKDCQEFWNEALNENVYVICKTPMAKSITMRTLRGYSKAPVNIHYFEDLLNMLKNKKEQFLTKVLKESYWNKGNKEMRFDAVVGNPPYQDSTSVNNRQGPIYPYFYNAAENLSQRYSLISPARFLFNAGLTSKEWNQKMLNDPHIRVVRYEKDATTIFPNTEIKGGVAIVERDATRNFGAIGTFIYDENIRSLIKHFVPDEANNMPSIMFGGRSDLKFNDVFIKAYPHSPSDRLAAIQKEHPDVIELGPGEEYELKSSTLDVLSYAFENKAPEHAESYYSILGVSNGSRVFRWISKEYMTPRYADNNLSGYKVFIPKASGDGTFGEKIGTPVLAGPNVSATPSFISIGNFATENEAVNAEKYIRTRFARALLSILKVTQDIVPGKWAYVPLQDFTAASDINWNQSITDIDEQLFVKYHFTDSEIEYIKNNVKSMDSEILSEYRSFLKMSYSEIVKNLLKKYGPAKHDYFKDTNCTQKNEHVSRTKEGLVCHHIDEDKAILLSNDKFASKNPFEYQKANRLVYCNLIEHLLLHVKIAEEPKHKDANPDEVQGIGGAVSFICHELNDIYAGKEFSQEWKRNVADKVKNDFDDYIAVLKRLWIVVEKNPLLHAIITKEDICTDSDGKCVVEVLEALD